MASTSPSLPTYLNAAGVLERKTGSGVKLAAWTAARTLLIAPPFLVIGVEPKKAWGGALLASLLISGLTVARIFAHGPVAKMHAKMVLHGPTTQRRSRRR